ncbi:MAG: Lrp/AsnC family transcriptional regulator [Leucobacter sp.]|nr:Lrp/AsnC family transcriptional regulator [Leucobacter sp.]
MPEQTVTEQDLELIHVLQVAPQISWTDAGKVLNAHPTTLASRWEQLHRAGLAWITSSLNVSRAGLLLAFLEITCELSQRDEFIQAVCLIPEVQTVEIAARNKDLELTVITSSLTELSQRVLPQITSIPGVLRVDTSIATKIHRAGHDWRLDSLSRQQLAALGELRAVDPQPSGQIPPSYLPTLRVLSRNGRASSAEISRSTGIHKATVRRQINRMKASGALASRCEVAGPRLGYPVNCIWYANLPAERHGEAAAALSTLRNLRLCMSTTGPTNLLFSLWLRSTSEILPQEVRITDLVPGIQLAERSVVMSTAKRLGWLLNPDGTSKGVLVTYYP